MIKRSEVVLPLTDVPTSADPASLVSMSPWYVAKLITDALFVPGLGYAYEPMLAESYSWSQDGRSLSVKLKTMQFSDGSPLTSGDVRVAVERCTRGAKRLGRIGLTGIVGYDRFESGDSEHLDGFEIIDDRSFVIRTERSSGILMADLANNACYIVKPSEQNGYDLLAGALGVGPYRLVSRSNDEILLERSPTYHVDTDLPQFVRFRLITNGPGQGKAFDMFDGSSAYLKSDDKEFYRPFEVRSLGAETLYFNQVAGPLAKKEVREALYVGFDVNEMAERLGWKLDRIGTGPISFGVAGFQRRPVARDVSAASTLLKSAGYTEANPLEFTLLVADNSGSLAEVKAWKEVAFSDLPVVVNARLVGLPEILEAVKGRSYHAFRAIKYASNYEANGFLEGFRGNSPVNYTGFRNAECDALLDEAGETSSYEARISIFRRAQDCIMGDFPVIPLQAIKPRVYFLRKPWALPSAGSFVNRPYYVAGWSRND